MLARTALGRFIIPATVLLVATVLAVVAPEKIFFPLTDLGMTHATMTEQGVAGLALGCAVGVLVFVIAPLLFLVRRSAVVPASLLAGYVVLFVFLAFAPVDRPTWFAENLTVWIILAIIGGLWWRGVRLSGVAYAMMAVLVYLHTIGGHFTFALVPFDWVTDLFGFERNHFDRLAHFTVGFYAYPIAEWLWQGRMVKNRFLLFTYPVFVIMAVALTYELVEWWYARGAESAIAAANYLGSQGDIWDAQKDMLADTLGAIAGTSFFFWVRGVRRLRAELMNV
jgi:putative membrane protein